MHAIRLAGPADHAAVVALVNEAYVRLLDVQHVSWQNRAHFLAMAARLMRRILVDAARSKRNQKRGGEGIRVTFDERLALANEDGHDLVAINDALDALARVDERKSRVAEHGTQNPSRSTAPKCSNRGRKCHQNSR